jgi:hypothetical protein
VPGVDQISPKLALGAVLAEPRELGPRIVIPWIVDALDDHTPVLDRPFAHGADQQGAGLSGAAGRG